MDPGQSIGDRTPAILLDGEPHEGVGPSMTGAQILALAGHEADTDASCGPRPVGIVG